MNYFGENNQKKIFFKTFSKDLLKRYNLKKEDYIKNLNQNFNENIVDLNEILVISQPIILKEIAERYLKVGIDFIGTLSEKGNFDFLKNFNLEDLAYDINFNASKIIRELTVKYSTLNLKHKRYTVGCIEDTEKNKNNTDIYLEQLKTLISGKSDLIYLKSFNETDKLNDLLSKIDNLMIKRNKEIDLIICFDLDEKIKNFEKNCISLSNTNIIATGISIEENLIENIKDYSYSYISLSIENYSKVDKICDLIKNNNEIRIINLHNGFIPDSIEKIIHNVQNNL